MVYLIRHAEIGTKGKNKILFERKLVQNIKSNFAYHNREGKITLLHGRILVEGERLECLRTVFGIASFSEGQEVERTIDALQQEALRIAKRKNPSTFCVHTKRIDKTFLLESPKISEKVGGYVFENLNIPVTFANPELVIYIEMFNGKSYMFTEKVRGAGGLPVGIEGIATLTISSNDDILAGLLMMKRGCDLSIKNLGNKNIALLESYGYKKQEKMSPYTISSATLTNVKDYKPTTFYPLIRYTKKTITHEISNYKERMLSK